MAKKKNPIAAPADSLVSEAACEYEAGVWAGIPHHQCKLCHFDTLAGLDVMLTHLVERHSSEMALEALFPSSPTAADPVDLTNDINQIEEVKDGATNPE